MPLISNPPTNTERPESCLLIYGTIILFGLSEFVFFLGVLSNYFIYIYIYVYVFFQISLFWFFPFLCVFLSLLYWDCTVLISDVNSGISVINSRMPCVWFCQIPAYARDALWYLGFRNYNSKRWYFMTWRHSWPLIIVPFQDFLHK